MNLEQSGEEKLTAVLLLNLGGPDSLQAVRPFLYNLFSDREIIRLPLQSIMARLISSSRAKKVIPRYEQIGGKSPLLDLTREQAKALEEKLNQSSEYRVPSSGLRDPSSEFRVYVGMRYWHPFIEEPVSKIIKDGNKQMVVLSLFPQYSRATTGSCFKELERVLKRIKADLKVVYIEHWHDNPTYLNALAQRIKEGLEGFPQSDRQKVQVIFTAHSLPQDFIDQGDPYLKHLQETIAGLLERLGPLSWQLAFQSRSGPVKWMEPAADLVLERLAEEGHRQILLVPLSFVSDHIETLYEIDIMYRELAEAKGVTNYRRSPSLNSSPLFIQALAEIVQAALRGSEPEMEPNRQARGS